MKQFNIGDRVTYNPGYKKEHGVVKSVASDGNYFVVYNCGGEWEHYHDYTAAKTPADDLYYGWF